MTLAGLLQRLEGVPVVRILSRVHSDRRFVGNTRSNLFRGVFPTFAAAEASAPAVKPLGYDNPASADLYLRRLDIDDYDYPAMFWIATSLSEGMRRIADLGGSVGIKYFAFSRFIPFPPDLLWRVIDVPAVVTRGRQFAAERGITSALEFSDRLADADGMDVLFASGVLQYLPESLADMLDHLPNKPARIVVNTTPIHETRSFFTVNSIGTAYCAYRVQGRDEFVSALNDRGYRLRHEWVNVGKRLRLPQDPAHSLENYSGFCFDR